MLSLEDLGAVMAAGLTAVGGVFALGKQKQRIDDLEKWKVESNLIPERLASLEAKVDIILDKLS